jgi:hypothetical protein
MWDVFTIGTFNFRPMLITGNPLFDYFFTLISISVVLSVAIGLMLRIVSRS